MTRFAACLTALVITLFVTAPAGAAIRHDSDKLLLLANPMLLTPSAPSKQAYYDHMFLDQGIEPGSNKAQIIQESVEKIRRDPTINATIPGGEQGIHHIFLDPETREHVMTSGLAQLSAADRLSYVQLQTRFLDELVPVNCFGEVDMDVVMNRVTLREMSDDDARQYFDLLFKVLTGYARKTPIILPTAQQYAVAQRQLARALFIQLNRNQSDFARFQTYTMNPSQATPSDACWATRVTLHAIISMPDPGRDFILLRTILQGKQNDNSANGQTAPSGAPVPASPRPPGTPAP